MKKKIINDILFYLIIPLTIWNFGRTRLGDYYAMLLTSLPGLIYVIYGFIRNRQYNVTGIYILVSLIFARSLDLAANSAEKMLWNGVYIDIAHALFLSLSIAVRQPICMYFFIDASPRRGIARNELIKLYKRKDLFNYFQYLTGFFILNHLEEVFLKTWFIGKFDVDGFNQISIIMTANGYLFVGLKLLFVIFIMKKIQQVLKEMGVNLNFKQMFQNQRQKGLGRKTGVAE